MRPVLLNRFQFNLTLHNFIANLKNLTVIQSLFSLPVALSPALQSGDLLFMLYRSYAALKLQQTDQTLTLTEILNFRKARLNARITVAGDVLIPVYREHPATAMLSG